MRQEIVDAAVQVSGQPLEDVTQVGIWIVAVQPRRVHEAHHDGSALAGEFAASEQPCFAPHGPWAQEVLQAVVIHAHRAVLDGCA